MSKSSRSPKAVLQIAYQVGRSALPKHWHRYSPKKFTLPQLFACLALKEFLRLDYRRLSSLLNDSSSLLKCIELEHVPHFTTFQKAAARLLRSSHAQRLLSETIQKSRALGMLGKRLSLAAIDGTGFETRHVSGYFVRRRARARKPYKTLSYHHYPTVSAVCDCASHLVVAAVPGRGPNPDDKYYYGALDQAVKRSRIDTLLADAGYDSEAAHVFAREKHKMRTIIPPLRGRPTKKLPAARWRRRMATHFNRTKYGQRWQIETVYSMIKRNLGSALRARSYWSQCREIMLKVLTHNIMIL